MHVERKTYWDQDCVCVGGDLTIAYGARQDAAAVELERILRQYLVRPDSSHFYRDDVAHCRYQIDPDQWLNEDFQQAIMMWQLEH